MIGNNHITALERTPVTPQHCDADREPKGATRSMERVKPERRQPSTRAGAIAAFCMACGHDPMDRGTWREQISACPAGDCPLHRFRPMARGVKPGSAALAALRLRLDKAGEVQ